MDRNSIRINDTIQLKISNYVCNRINLILLVPTKLLFVFKWFVMTRWTSSSINMPPQGTVRHAATKRSGIWQLDFRVQGWKHSWTFLDWKILTNSIYLSSTPFSVCLSVCLPFPVYDFNLLLVCSSGVWLEPASINIHWLIAQVKSIEKSYDDNWQKVNLVTVLKEKKGLGYSLAWIDDVISCLLLQILVHKEKFQTNGLDPITMRILRLFTPLTSLHRARRMFNRDQSNASSLKSNTHVVRAAAKCHNTQMVRRTSFTLLTLGMWLLNITIHKWWEEHLLHSLR